MIVMRRSERNATPFRSGNLRVGGVGGPAFQTAEAATDAGAPSFAQAKRADTTAAYTTV